jgi:hypothetical protein
MQQMRARIDAKNPFIKLGLCHTYFHRSLSLYRRSQNHDPLLGTRNGSLDEEQILFGAHIYNFQILDRYILVTPVTSHFLTLAHSPWIGSVTDRSTMSEIFVSTMRSRKSGKGPSLDNPGEAMSFRNPGNIDEISDLEQISHFDLLAHLIPCHIVRSEFSQNRKCAFACLGHVPLNGLINPLALLAAEAYLQGIVTV